MRLAAVLALAALTGCRSAAASEAKDPPSIRRTLTVGFVIVDGVYDTELVLPLDVFHHTVFHAQPAMQVFTVAPSLEPVRTFEGLRLLPDHTFEDAPEIDVLVVPSAEHSLDTDLEDQALIRFVRERGSQARYVVSLCDGAFVLARAGLLDGRSSTTFPADVGRMREKFPRLRVIEGVSFVHDGPVITSAGGAKSADAALYLAGILYGPEAAREIGRGLCIEWDLAQVPHVTR